ncbi:MAG: lipopolysaccharide biosynthesis protein [Terriglobales bacterium]
MTRMPDARPGTRTPFMSWREALALLRSEPAHSRILGGSLVMLFGSGLVSAVNFAYNIAVARLLGPSSFGHAAAIVTLLMLVSAITLSFQLVCAKFVARNVTDGSRAAVYSSLHRRAWKMGLLLGSALVFASGAVANYLNLPSSSFVIVLAMGVAFYIPLGVKRGGLQGVCAFPRLSINFLIEAIVKFVGAIVLIELGYGVLGAVAAIAVSVVLAYFVPRAPVELRTRPEPGVPASFGEGMQAIVFFVGQVVINNIDILLVKHFFAATEAGIYAAVALVGRAVYFFSWSVVSVMFPISAGSKPQEDNASVLAVPMAIVTFIALAFTVGLGLFPDFALRIVFGPVFHQVGQPLEGLLSLYAAATGAYSLSVVLMAYEMSRRLAKAGWVQLAFSGGIVLGIYFFHQSLREVILVQLVLMVFLLIVCAMPFFRRDRAVAPAVASGGIRAVKAEPLIRRLRRVAEAEVIADFLKSEFHHQEFLRDRDRFEALVMAADTSNEAENALRRALLFRRRATMWRELPSDTQWWEVELNPAALPNLRVFPRAQWRKVASGNFRLGDIVERIRSGRFPGRTRHFASQLLSLSHHLRYHDGHRSTVLLIGIDEQQPLTILEGNHRLTAAMLASPQIAGNRFRYICGLSPRMNECCWYETNLANLWRYARNRLKILMYDREADIAQLLTSSQSSQFAGNMDTSEGIAELSGPQIAAVEKAAATPSLAQWDQKQAS